MQSSASEGYSRADVRRILNIRENSLRAWERHGLLAPQREFGFKDLIALKTLQKLRENQIPNKQIKLSLTALAKKLDGIDAPLTQLKIVSDGRQIAVELPGHRMEALTGQILFNFEVASIAAIPVAAEKRKSPASERAREAERWFRRGLELEENGSSSSASIEAYQKALDLNPSAAGAWVNIGTLYYRQASLREAEDAYRKALALQPQYALAHFNLGNICDELGRHDEAMNSYKLALHYHSKYADAHYNLALLYEKRNEPMRAARHWRSYLKLDGSSPWSSIARRQLQSIVQVTPGGKQ